MRKILCLLICLALVTGCSINVGSTGDRATDPSAARALLPQISGYTRTDADSITDALAATGAGAAALSGNLIVAGAIAQIDRMLQCYREVGAVAASVYTQLDIGSLLQNQVPRVGAVGVINQDRLVNNFMNCAVGRAGGFSAQGAEIEPCGGSGSLVINNETIHYVYAATVPQLCQEFQLHFDRLLSR
jgi:hypothetical protein